MRAALALVAAAIVFVFAPLDAFAQTPMVPYFGKNQIRYTNFRWNIYTTDHFEITTTPKRNSISNASQATPRARTSTSART